MPYMNVPEETAVSILWLSMLQRFCSGISETVDLATHCHNQEDYNPHFHPRKHFGSRRG